MPRRTINRRALPEPGHQIDNISVTYLGDLAMRLGRVDRITFHQDGKTPESDTDHTVMLGLVAVAFAARHLPNLDLGLIAILSLVHDLPEVFAGDTPTLRITPEEMAAKRAREAEAREQLAHDLSRLPIIPEMIDLYENRMCAEARYVWAMDKLLPKITHMINGGATFKAQGMGRQELAQRYAQQGEELAMYAADYPPLMELRAQLIQWLIISGHCDPVAQDGDKFTVLQTGRYRVIG